MPDPLSMLASCLAVAGLGVKVAKVLDTLFHQWNDVGENLIGLKIKIQSFCASLQMLYDWMAQEYLTSPSSGNVNFVKNLALSGEGCLRILLALKFELDIVCGIANKLRQRDKLLFMWNQNRIKELEGHLNSQTLGLMLLLTCRQFSQRQTPVIRSPDDQAKMKIVQQDVEKLHERGDSVGNMLGESSDQNSSGKLGASRKAEDVEESERYQTALTYLTQSARMPETIQPSQNAVANLPRIPFAEKIRDEYQEKVSNDLNFLVPECLRMKILVIGKVEAGKSTLCARLLGISDEAAGVTEFGDGTPASRVWDPLTGNQNPHLILHDSGGFDTSSSSQKGEIEAFIKSCREQKLLKDQLHCILYCISCVGGRPFQKGAEHWFFDEVDTGQIPVFVVFTHYDAIIDRHHKKWRTEHSGKSNLSEEQAFAVAEEPAFPEYQQKYENGIQSIIQGKPNVKICRLSIREGKEYKLQKYPHKSPNDIASLSDLTEAIRVSLEKEKGLEMTWIALQRVRADLKLGASLTKTIDQYWKVQRVSKIPLIPLICLRTLGQAYDVILCRLSQIWGLKTEPVGLLTSWERWEYKFEFGFLEATFDQSTEVLLMSSAAIATYNLGALTGTQKVRMILKMIVGLTLIFEQLFLHQQKQGDDAPPLTKATIREISRSFQMSTSRKQMSAHIDKTIVWDTRYKLEVVKSVAKKAMESGKSRIAQKYSKNEYDLWNALQDDGSKV